MVGSMNLNFKCLKIWQFGQVLEKGKWKKSYMAKSKEYNGEKKISRWAARGV